MEFSIEIKLLISLKWPQQKYKIEDLCVLCPVTFATGSVGMSHIVDFAPF